MAMKRKVKILLVAAFLIVLIPVLLIFVFPYFDFMYVSADKYWLKGKIADQDDNTGGKSIKKVEQGENVEYFVYKDRLISIEDTDDKAKEICKLPNDIVGVSVKDKDILLYDNNSILAQEILKKETMLREVLLRKMMVLNTEEQDIYN